MQQVIGDFNMQLLLSPMIILPHPLQVGGCILGKEVGEQWLGAQPHLVLNDLQLPFHNILQAGPGATRLHDSINPHPNQDKLLSSLIYRP